MATTKTDTDRMDWLEGTYAGVANTRRIHHDATDVRPTKPYWLRQGEDCCAFATLREAIDTAMDMQAARTDQFQAPVQKASE